MVSISVDGPDLVIEADRDVPEALIAELREHKPELLSLLSGKEDSDGTPRFSVLYDTEAAYQDPRAAVPKLATPKPSNGGRGRAESPRTIGVIYVARRRRP